MNNTCYMMHKDGTGICVEALDDNVKCEHVIGITIVTSKRSLLIEDQWRAFEEPVVGQEFHATLIKLLPVAIILTVKTGAYFCPMVVIVTLGLMFLGVPITSEAITDQIAFFTKSEKE